MCPLDFVIRRPIANLEKVVGAVYWGKKGRWGSNLSLLFSVHSIFMYYSTDQRILAEEKSESPMKFSWLYSCLSSTESMLRGTCKFWQGWGGDSDVSELINLGELVHKKIPHFNYSVSFSLTFKPFLLVSFFHIVNNIYCWKAAVLEMCLKRVIIFSFSLCPLAVNSVHKSEWNFQ